MLPTLFLLPAVLSGPAAEAPPPTPADLDALFQRLLGGDAADRLAAARVLADEPPSGVDLYAKRLRRPRAVAAATFRSMVLEIWAQVPDPDYLKTGNLWLQKPEPPWKPPPVARGARKNQPRPRRPPPHDPEKVDWLDALAELDVDGNEVLKGLPDRSEARAEATEAVALLRAIAAAGRTGDTAALDPLFDFAFDLDGVFRDECGRAIRSMGSQAIPGLIRRHRAQASKALRGVALFRRKRYASYQLDRMDRAQPVKAIATAPDDRIRADILHAYGEVRALDAVDAILGQTDAASRRVREEARWAWRRYVEGPPPPPAPRRKRKLPGGKAESEEKEDYLDYREMAVLALNKALGDLHGDEPCASCAPLDADGKPSPHADAKRMTDELFAFYDRRRAARWEVEWGKAKSKADAGDLAGAVADYSWILAHDPLYERRAEMADTFFAYGASLEKRDPERAIAILREAVALDPASKKAARADAEIHFLDGMRRLRAGSADPADFRRALVLDPTFDEARVALRGLESGRRRPVVLQATAIAAVALGAFAMLLAAATLVSRLRSRAG